MLNPTCNPRRLSHELWTVVSSMLSTTTGFPVNFFCNNQRSQRIQMLACTTRRKHVPACSCQWSAWLHKPYTPCTTLQYMNTPCATHVPDLSFHLRHGDVLTRWKQAPSDVPSLSEETNPIVPGVLVLLQRSQLLQDPRACRTI